MLFTESMPWSRSDTAYFILMLYFTFVLNDVAYKFKNADIINFIADILYCKGKRCVLKLS